MNPILLIAAKEWRDGLRNRWVIATTTLLAALALTLAFLGSAPTGAVKVASLAVTVVSLSSLTIFLVPLIALLLSHDAIVGEIERGTMSLLLTYPVERWQTLLGKFVGHLSILAFATVVGYGLAGLAAQWAGGGDGADWSGFALLVATSILLGGVFLALGYLISAAVGDRGAAGGLAVGVWLLFVLIYDMALLGALAVDQGRVMTSSLLDVFLLANPADAYRLLNLTATRDVSALSGVVGLGARSGLGPLALLAALTAWMTVPLVAAMAIFARRPV